MPLDYSVLSDQLLKKVATLSGYRAWRAPDAREVIDQFASAGFIITGAELWEDAGGRVKYIRNFAAEPAALISCKAAADSVQSFVSEFANYPGGFFNFSGHTQSHLEN